VRRLQTALALAFITLGCAGLKPPPQLSPIGDIAFYAEKTLVAVESLQHFAIDGEAAGAISTNDAKTIIEATKVAGQAGQDLKRALKAGASETAAKNQAVAAIRSALDSVPKRLSPETAAIVAPYIQTVTTLLEVFS
jgi:hypothetical protein